MALYNIVNDNIYELEMNKYKLVKDHPGREKKFKLYTEEIKKMNVLLSSMFVTREKDNKRS